MPLMPLYFLPDPTFNKSNLLDLLEIKAHWKLLGFFFLIDNQELLKLLHKLPPMCRKKMFFLSGIFPNNKDE